MSHWDRRELNKLVAEHPDEYKKRFPEPFTAMIPEDASSENKLVSEKTIEERDRVISEAINLLHSEGGGGGSDPDSVKFTEQELTEEQKAQARTNIGAGTYSKPSGGIPASDLESGVIPSVPTISTDIETDKASDAKTASPKAVYDEVHPAVASSQPQGGFLPNVFYNLGALTGSVTFALATPSDNTIANHYYWTFETGSTAPTITWPNGITWLGGSAPTINNNKHYEISVLNNIGMFLEV